MPGLSAAEACAISAGEFDIPFLPELPERGPGADLIGRTLGLVHGVTGEFAAITTASGWQLAGVRAGGEPGRVMRRARSWLSEDLDEFEAACQGFTGTVKFAVAGPWTLAAAVEDRSGNRVLADRGACADLAQALASAAADLVATVARRIPGCDVVVQFDEPLLPTVLAGRVPTASGRTHLAVPPQPVILSGLQPVVGAAVAAGAVPALHSCARVVPFALAEQAGVVIMSVDTAAVGSAAQDEIARWWDRGAVMSLGVAPAIAAAPSEPAGATAIARSVAGLWSRIGFASPDVGPRTILTPTCGLAGAAPAWARSVGAVLRRAAVMLETAD